MIKQVKRAAMVCVMGTFLFGCTDWVDPDVTNYVPDTAAPSFNQHMNNLYAPPMYF